MVRALIWLALGAWGLAEWWRLREPRPAPPPARARIAWTLGAVFALLHALAAFHVHYGWSHAAAVADTARQTEQALGFRFGTGLFVNHVFVAVWLADAVWWWLSPASFHARRRVIDTRIRLFLLFIFVNGTIVFAHGPVRFVGLAIVAALAGAWYRGRGARAQSLRS